MKIWIPLFLFMLVCYSGSCQSADEFKFTHDTMTFTGTDKVLEGDYVETTLKNFSVVRLFKTNDDKYYLRFIVTKNFYFNKVATLEIQSGSRSYYAKETKQHKITKTSGLFIIEIFKNYIGTIKDDGITGIVFGEAETDFTKQDTKQIKAMATFFYNSIAGSKK
jgi:hypothetical protein